MTYYNTTHIRGQALIKYKAKACDQEAMIYEFFSMNPSIKITPEDISNYHPEFDHTPITSIRRAFTNLKNLNLIFKTDNQVDGMYWRPIYTWQLVPTNGQMELVQ